MAWWLWLLDTTAVLLALVLLYGLALVVRRRVLARRGGTFDRPGRGWLLGVGRYSGECLEWYRIFSLSPRPKRSWLREELTYRGRRDTDGHERLALFPEHVVVSCDSPQGEVELAMGPASLTGFQAWLEARPPGAEMPGSRGQRR